MISVQTITIVVAVVSFAVLAETFSIYQDYPKHVQNPDAGTYSAVGNCPEKDPANPVYLPDSERCDIYYECSGGVAIKNDCPPDLEFNPILNVCDFPENAGCEAGDHATEISVEAYSAVGTCPEKDPANPVYLPDSERCDIYYECSGGIPIMNNCPPDQEFNPVLHVCDFPIDAGCKANNGTFFSASMYSAVGTCPEKDPANPVYLPDSERCDIYYECSGGIPIMNNCPPDQEFNPVLHVCDFPIDAGCKANNDTLVEASMYSAVGTCPEKDPANPVYLPDSERCDIYYECSGGIPIMNNCPPDQEFNPVLHVCDFPIDAGCKANNGSDVSPVAYSAVGICPEKDPGTPVYLPDAERCDIYYECSGGVPIPNECPPNLEFNPVLNVCDFAIDSGCKAGEEVTEGFAARR